MKILTVGGGGQVGRKILEIGRRKNHEMFATFVTRTPNLPPSHTYALDKTDRKAVLDIIERVRPDAVIDTAALHNVDYCENHKEEAWKVNVQGSKHVAEGCSKRGARLVFVSTDYVFDGKKGNYSESDPPSPVNYYGATKLEAEKVVEATCPNHLIVRPSVIYSWIPTRSDEKSASGKPMNFAMWVYSKLTNYESIRVVDDQYGSPTLADSLAEGIITGVESGKRDLYHVAGATRLSRYEFTLRLAETLDLEKSLVARISTHELRQAAARPMDVSLNVARAERDFNMHLLRIDEALSVLSKQSYTKH